MARPPRFVDQTRSMMMASAMPPAMVFPLRFLSAPFGAGKPQSQFTRKAVSMSLIREQSTEAMGGEISDLGMQGLNIELHGHSPADVL